jgi:hypothetical protein
LRHSIRVREALRLQKVGQESLVTALFDCVRVDCNDDKKQTDSDAQHAKAIYDEKTDGKKRGPDQEEDVVDYGLVTWHTRDSLQANCLYHHAR